MKKTQEQDSYWEHLAQFSRTHPVLTVMFVMGVLLAVLSNFIPL